MSTEKKEVNARESKASTLTRRDALKGLAAGAAGLAAVVTCPPEIGPVVV